MSIFLWKKLKVIAPEEVLRKKYHQAKQLMSKSTFQE